MEQRYISDNQSNMNLLLRLLTIQEQNYQLLLNNRQSNQATTANEPITFLLPSINPFLNRNNTRNRTRRKSLCPSKYGASC